VSEELPVWFQPPKLGAPRFTCPHCMANTVQKWENPSFKGAEEPTGGITYYIKGELALATCESCHHYSLWRHADMIYPKMVFSAVYPHADLPEDVKRDFLEARSVVYDSPRAASALLRLCIDKLCIHLQARGSDLNARIGDLVKRDLPVQVQQTMDYVRVVGNNAVHPGVMDGADTLETAMTLFECVNLVTSTMIAQPKRVSDLYGRIPEGRRQQIEKRDAT
jgi:hypothetical protein